MAGSAKISNMSAYDLAMQYNQYISLSGNLANHTGKIDERVTELQKVWTGKRFNKVITLYNSKKREVDDQMKFFLRTMPEVLKSMIDNYAKVNNENVTLNFKVAGSGLCTKKVGDDTIVKYNYGKVNTYIINIKTYLTNIDKEITSMVNLIKEIEKNSGALTSLSSSYQKKAATNKEGILSKLGKGNKDVTGSFATELLSAHNDMRKTEQNNLDDVAKTAIVAG